MSVTYMDGAAKNPDNVLRQAIGEYESVFILGYDKDGVMDARASTNLSRERILWLMETFKETLMGME